MSKPSKNPWNYWAWEDQGAMTNKHNVALELGPCKNKKTASKTESIKIITHFNDNAILVHELWKL